MADRSCRLLHDGWARAVARAAEEFGADRVVAERNYGGAMVEAVLRSAAPNMPVHMVTASRERCCALYEQGKVHHVGQFAELDEQMTMTTAMGYHGSGSPDRLDALVWALTEIMAVKRPYNLVAIIGEGDWE